MRCVEDLRKVFNEEALNNIEKYTMNSKLYVELTRFIRILENRNDFSEEKNMSDVFRRLIHFRFVLDDIILSYEKELSDKGVEEFFNEEKELVITQTIDNEKITVVKPIETSVEWQRAVRRKKEEEK